MESTSPTTNVGTVLAPSDDLLYEVVDGQVVELAPMGAYEIRIASVLLMYLETFARQYRLGRAVQEMLFDLTTVQRQRRPDVAFVSYDRWPRQRRVPRTEAWEVVPNLVVEVVSPTDRVDDVVDKVAERAVGSTLTGAEQVNNLAEHGIKIHLLIPLNHRMRACSCMMMHHTSTLPKAL